MGEPGSGAMRAYAAATWAATPLVTVALLAHRCGVGRADTRAQMAQRDGRATLPRPPGALLWVHAVSLGEGAAAAPLVDALRAAHPLLTVLLTAGSSAALAARAAAPRWAGVLLQLAPVDTPAAVARFLAHWRPCAALFLESELWPNLLEAAARAALPVLLLNARARPAARCCACSAA
jgi:3-deoxy-D-manno-octulosonic-acid transferase